MPLAPDLDGGSGNQFDGGDQGGGVPGTPTGSSQGESFPATENGGVFASTYFLFVPVQNINTKQCDIFFYDVDDFNDPTDGSYYDYRAEDIVKNAQVTVNEVWLMYRDLGLAKLTVTLTGTNDNQAVVSNSVVQQIGNALPTGAICSIKVSISLTAFRPQLTLTRQPGDGQVCITSVTMRGEVGER